jgi:glycerophosphoryl diester phosphodiesterase
MTDLIAHRGFAGDHPENTLGAVRTASTAADAVEVDVRRCDSGDLVVVHDETVDRVTDASGPVSEFSREELAALDVFDSGEGVPTLAAVLSAAGDTLVNVELKEAVAEDVVRVVDEVDANVLYSSFHPEHLRALRAADPDADLAFVTHGGTEDPIGHTTALDCVAVHPEASTVDTDLVAEAHEAGLAVNAWTVRDRETAKHLREAGVDGIVSDLKRV